MSNSILSSVKSCFNGRKGKYFCIVSWLVMKIGFSTITISVEDRNVSPAHASTSAAKPNILVLKFLLYIWSDQLGVFYYEQLKSTETITGDCYRLQLMCLSRALKKKGRCTSRDTTKWFCNVTTQDHMLQKGWKPTWKCLNEKSYLQPPNSSDIASSNYYLFWSMAYSLV